MEQRESLKFIEVFSKTNRNSLYFYFNFKIFFIYLFFVSHHINLFKKKYIFRIKFRTVFAYYITNLLICLSLFSMRCRVHLVSQSKVFPPVSALETTPAVLLLAGHARIGQLEGNPEPSSKLDDLRFSVGDQRGFQAQVGIQEFQDPPETFQECERPCLISDCAPAPFELGVLLGIVPVQAQNYAIRLLRLSYPERKTQENQISVGERYVEPIYFPKLQPYLTQVVGLWGAQSQPE